MARLLPASNRMETAAPQEPRFTPIEIRTSKGHALQVREYAFEDFKGLVEMYKGFAPKRLAQGLPPPDLRRIAHWLDRLQHQSRALVAWDGKRAVAHALLCPTSDASVEFAVFVHQEYRRAGLGTQLAGLAINLAARCGFAELVVTSNLSNVAAVRLYRKVGFHLAESFGSECELKMALARAEGALPRAA
jgi:ribosomal protein S18 acetylase RimI-like enzyme